MRENLRSSIPFDRWRERIADARSTGSWCWTPIIIAMGLDAHSDLTYAGWFRLPAPRHCNDNRVQA